MPIELQQRVRAADPWNLAPCPMPVVADNDDWSGVFCCSAMRPRNQADVAALHAAGQPEEPWPADES